MNRTKTTPSSASSPSSSSKLWKSKCPFNFVIAYEDTATRNRVYNLYDHLSQQLFDEFDFHGVWYPFDMLASNIMRDAATQEAAEAQMIVLSLRQGNSLPGHVIDWIDAWIDARDSQKGALVTLVAGDAARDRAPGPIEEYLQKAATRANLDFFANNFDLPSPARPRSSPDDNHSNTRHSGSRFEDVPDRSRMISHWGINE